MAAADDADMPDMAELEWLESNSALYCDATDPADDDEYFPFDEVPAQGPEIDRPQKRLRTSDPFAAIPPDLVPPTIPARASPPPPPVELVDLEPSPSDFSEAASFPDVEPPVIEKTISRFASQIDGHCMPITGPDGQRVYAKMRFGELISGDKRSSITRRPLRGLLEEPFHVLERRVEQAALAKAMQESSEFQEHGCLAKSVTEQLWVEKYAPKAFSELLSDEHTNREVLLWLKQWDSCVFGCHVTATSDDVLSSLRRHSSIVNNLKFSGNKRIYTNSSITHSQKLSHGNVKENDRANGFLGRRSKACSVSSPPEQKVLLLCGSPGLGKTTLAHIAAKHCGYRVVEINASDDRSASSIESRILDVVQMNSMSDKRPHCLVIDEIDGALSDGKGAVDVIIKLVANEKNSTDKAKSSEEAQAQKTSSKKAQKLPKLLRPIICICNDLFAPALRHLRQVAKVHVFVQPTISRVVSRLKYICQQEGFQTSTIALSALAEHTECDIRSCLNTLQFLNKKREALNALEVASQVVGMKDMSKSVFDVWKAVFQKKRRRPGGEVDSARLSDRLYSLMSNRGEFDLTMDGIHDNFLRLSYHDPIMQKTVKCLNALGVSDSLLQYTFRTQQMSMHAYQSPVAIEIYHLLAQVEKPNIEWPKSSHRCRTMLLENTETLKTWQKRILPPISRHLSVVSFVEHNVSLCLHILFPPNLRPVALHLLSDREKDELAHLVNTMVSYSLTYKSTKLDLPEINGQKMSSDVAVLSLDPPIDDFVNFKGRQSNHLRLSLAMKQIVVHEVEKQRIVQENATKAPTVSNGSHAKVEDSKNTLNKALPSRNSAAPAFIDRKTGCGSTLIDSKSTKKPSVQSTDFFRRFRKENPEEPRRSKIDLLPKTTERDMRPLLFKFNEGFTNAVKRPVKVRDLLLQ